MSEYPKYVVVVAFGNPELVYFPALRPTIFNTLTEAEVYAAARFSADERYAWRIFTVFPHSEVTGVDVITKTKPLG